MRSALQARCCFLAGLLLVSLPGCDRLPKGSQEVVDAYVAYRTALSAGDLQKASSLLSGARAKELAGDTTAPEQMKLAAFLLPSTMTVMEVTRQEGKARLSLREGVLVDLAGGTAAPPLGSVAGLPLGNTGKIDLLREEGRWKIDSESWSNDAVNPYLAAPPLPFLREGEALPRLQRSIGGGSEGNMRGGIAVLPDGATVITAGYGNYTLTRWSIADGAQLSSLKMEHRPTALAVTPDGTTAITADAYGGITFFPLTPAGFGIPHRTGSVGQCNDIAVSRDGRYLATASFDRTVTLWEIAGRREIARVEMPTPMRSVAFSPSGQLLAAGSAHNTFTLWDLASGEGRTYTIPKVDAKSDVSGIAFSPDGRRLATTHMDSSITLWDVQTQKEVKNFYVSQSSSWCVRFSPDGKLFATATQGGNIHLWDAATGDKLGSLQGQPSQPQGLAFSVDGSILFSTGEKGELAVWGK